MQGSYRCREQNLCGIKCDKFDQSMEMIFGYEVQGCIKLCKFSFSVLSQSTGAF